MADSLISKRLFVHTGGHMADVAHVAGEVRLIDLIWTTGITFITGVPDSEFRELIADLEDVIAG